MARRKRPRAAAAADATPLQQQPASQPSSSEQPALAAGTPAAAPAKKKSRGGRVNQLPTAYKTAHWDEAAASPGNDHLQFVFSFSSKQMKGGGGKPWFGSWADTVELPEDDYRALVRKKMRTTRENWAQNKCRPKPSGSKKGVLPKTLQRYAQLKRQATEQHEGRAPKPRRTGGGKTTENRLRNDIKATLLACGGVSKELAERAVSAALWDPEVQALVGEADAIASPAEARLLATIVAGCQTLADIARQRGSAQVLTPTDALAEKRSLAVVLELGRKALTLEGKDAIGTAAATGLLGLSRRQQHGAKGELALLTIAKAGVMSVYNTNISSTILPVAASCVRTLLQARCERETYLLY
jgi:hypothetical protein